MGDSQNDVNVLEQASSRMNLDFAIGIKRQSGLAREVAA
jgi:hypothetical protein